MCDAHQSGYLETLCDNLYDHLRPRILHEPALETLCGVCTVIQALMVQDVSAVEEEPEDLQIFSAGSSPAHSPSAFAGEDYFSLADESFSARQRRTGSVRGYSGSILTRRDAPRKPKKPLTRLHTEIFLRTVLQDAQTRLVFRAQALLRADVEYFVPSDKDLDYPAKIAGVEGNLVQRSVLLNQDEDEDEQAFLILPSAEAQESWYPSLRVTLWILSRLYTYIDVSVSSSFLRPLSHSLPSPLTIPPAHPLPPTASSSFPPSTSKTLTHPRWPCSMT